MPRHLNANRTGTGGNNALMIVIAPARENQMASAGLEATPDVTNSLW